MLIDMPVEKLREYRGINPKPADLDAYWSRALAELEATAAKAEFIPSTFQTPDIECLDLFFTGVGGSRIHAKVMRPRDPARRHGAAVVKFHGYSGNAGDWVSNMAYPANGFTYAALDCRGQSGHSEDLTPTKGNTLHGHIIRGLDDHPDKLLYRSIFLDCVRLIQLVAEMPGVDRNRIGVYGGSQGGALTLAAASLVPWVNRLVPHVPFLSDYQRVWEMDLAVNAYAELKEYFRFFDPRHEHQQEVFTRLGYIDVHHLAPRIRGKVIMFTGLMDTICPPSTQFAAYNAITSEKKVYLYPDFGHEDFPEQSEITMNFMLEMAK